MIRSTDHDYLIQFKFKFTNGHFCPYVRWRRHRDDPESSKPSFIHKRLWIARPSTGVTKSVPIRSSKPVYLIGKRTDLKQTHELNISQRGVELPLAGRLNSQGKSEKSISLPVDDRPHQSTPHVESAPQQAYSCIGFCVILCMRIGQFRIVRLTDRPALAEYAGVC
jgi:hypothetical protein